MNTTTPFWRFVASSTDQQPTLYLYGLIGDKSWNDDAVSPMAFKRDLGAIGSVPTLTLRVNSQGGDVFAGQAIYTMLCNHPAHITGYVDGVAASIASMILMAADRVIMPANATMMVHSPWSVVAGNARELRAQAEKLDRAQDGMLAAYASRAKVSDEELRALLEAETWMDAETAVTRGFADEVEPLTRVHACVRPDGLWEVNGQVLDLSGYRQRPEWMLQAAAETPDTDAGSAPDPKRVARARRLARTLAI
jgi:ATP-dependent Clp protease protease subunit